jgi:hypothetical protein
MDKYFSQDARNKQRQIQTEEFTSWLKRYGLRKAISSQNTDKSHAYRCSEIKLRISKTISYGLITPANAHGKYIYNVY